MIQETVKVMQNYTICIPTKVRNKLNIQLKDKMLLTYKNNQIAIKKIDNSWGSIAGIAKDSYKKLGGGEKFLKEERKKWEN